MEITIFAGKGGGGVGKSTVAAAFALKKSEYGGVLAIDYDGGHSLNRVFSLSGIQESNQILPTEIKNLNLAVIDPIKYTNITEFQKSQGDIDSYLAQFKKDYGIIPFCDMITTFFGVPTDPSSVSRFASLTNIYHNAVELKINNLIIDVEPTAGLERLLGSIDSTSISIKNLQELGIVKLSTLGVIWPEIKTYLQGEYIKNAKVYADRLIKTSGAIKGAEYFIVCIPESSPIDEMNDVGAIINSYNGNIAGYLINNIRGEPHESKQIKRVSSIANGLKVIKINHDLRLCDSNPRSRISALQEIGELI